MPEQKSVSGKFDILGVFSVFGLCIFFLAASLLLAACGENSTPTAAPAAGTTPTAPANTVVPATPTAQTSATTPATTAAANPTTSGGITMTTPTGNSNPGAGLPKEAITAILNDLKGRLNKDVVEKDIQVVSFSEMQFSDSSLGCPSPDAMYTQVITPGYRSAIQYGGKTYDYRINARGFRVVLCDGATNQPVKKVTP